MIEIWTDGGCRPNPGRGGWGVVIKDGEAISTFHGGCRRTTNNRMELMAAIMALNALNRGCDVRLSTDSVYVKDGITKWIHNWHDNGWKTANKKPVKNADLWQQLEAAIERHKVDWQWVKGHAGHPENERADELARQGMTDYLPSN